MARFSTFSRAGGPGILLGSGQGARKVEGLLIKGDPMFKERPHVIKDIGFDNGCGK